MTVFEIAPIIISAGLGALLVKIGWCLGEHGRIPVRRRRVPPPPLPAPQPIVRMQAPRPLSEQSVILHIPASRTSEQQRRAAR